MESLKEFLSSGNSASEKSNDYRLHHTTDVSDTLIMPIDATELFLVNDFCAIFQNTGRNVNISIADIVKNTKDRWAFDIVNALIVSPIKDIKAVSFSYL